jgi:hypothetical protein
MEIHEITKRPERTDEGILDNVKKAVKSAVTAGYNKVKAVATDPVGTYNKLSDWDIARRQNAAQDKINKSVEKSTAALRRRGYTNINPANLPMSKAATPDNIRQGTAGTRSGQFNGQPTAFNNKIATQQNAYNAQQQAQQAQHQAQLAQQFQANFVGPIAPNPTTKKTSSPRAPRPKKSKSFGQMISQLGTPTAPPAKPTATGGTVQPTRTGLTHTAAPKSTSSNAIGQMVNQLGNPSGPPPRTTDAGGTVQRTPTGLRHTAAPNNLNSKLPSKSIKKLKENGEFLTELKDIQNDFPSWIDSQIPGLARAKQDPDTRTKLQQAFSTMVKSKNDPTALMSAFNAYVSLATQATKQTSSGNPTQVDDQDWENSLPAYQQYKIDDLRKLIPPELAREIKRLQLPPAALAAYINRP